MKRLLARIKRQPGAPAADDTGFFGSLSHDSPEQKSQCSWATRAAHIEAKPVDRRQGTDLFMQLWRSDRHVVTLDHNDLLRMSQYLDFVQVPADREVIGQDEAGSYMLVVLEGTVAVDRGPAWGGKVRLAEARAGDMLGEMSLLDGGVRFSSCRTLTPCTLAVMDARRLDELVHKEPRLGVALLASLSRRLSLRLRQVSTRLSAVLSQK